MKPKLRFSNFINDYEIKDVSDITSNISSGKISKQLEDGEYNVYGSMGIIGKSNFYDYAGEKVLVARVGANAGSVNKINEKCCISDNTLVLEPKDILNDYLYYALSHYNPKKLIFGSGQPLVTGGQLKKIKLGIPSKEEQLKVSNFLSLLDKKIELQSKKIEDLKLFKKGLIHQMKKSSNNWSEYKISEIFKITRGVVIPKTDLLDNKTTEYQYPVYSSQTSNNGILGYDTKFDFDGKYLTWTTDGANAGKVFYRNGKFRCTNVCGVLYNDNNKYVDELTAELLNYETPKHVSYVGNPKLMNNVMGDIKIFLPDSNESDRVSNILLIINNKVLLETDKLNKLNKFKKGLMQNMFV
jgi:restriction endonuclease S subunit